MKALKPSHREHKRYLSLKGKDVNPKIVEETILKFIGVLGYGKASPLVVKKGKGSMILCINREMLDEVKASFATSNKDIIITKISGVVNKLK